MSEDKLPPPEELATIRAEAARLAGEAGALLLDAIRGPLDIRFKGEGERDPVTVADTASEAILRRGILDRFPDHAVLGEEDEAVTGNPEARYVWVLDPLDGTTNFMNGLTLFAVSIGVLHDAYPVAGAIFIAGGIDGAPCVLSAGRGLGATVAETAIDRTDREAVRLRIGTVPGGRRRRLGRGPRPEGLRLGDARSLGSIALELALVATGTLQYALFGRPRIWDVAAGTLIVAEAGGTVLVRGQHVWQPFERFETEQNSDSAPAALRNWRRTLVVGDEAAARYVAEATPGPPGVVRRMLNHLKR